MKGSLQKASPIVWLGTIIIFAIAGYYGWHELAMSPNKKQEGTIAVPEQYMISATSQNYNSQGILSYKMTGARIDHYKATDIYVVKSPFFEIYKPKQNNWYGQSQQATLNQQSGEIWLQKDVQLENSAAKQTTNLAISGKRPLQLATESLKIFPNEDLVISNVLVTVQQQQNQLSAIGIEMDMNHQTLILQNQVSSYFFQSSSEDK